MTRIFEQLLKIRGFTKEFLNPKYEECCDPFVLPDMEKAVQRIRAAVTNKEKILIYGDYDVDGVTATTLLYDTLKLAGANDVGTMLPNRFTDGYGMSKKVVRRAKDEGVGLVITVDCGSTNKGVVAELYGEGIETIVTDHHECPDELPSKAVAIVNPKRKDKDVAQELRDLAGVGVAFELARAMMLNGMIPEGQEKWLLDLVLIGTICDNMVISPENRRLCFFGMKVMQKTRRLGVKELMNVASVKRICTESIGFQLGPRLNAAGRMKSPDIALKLLMSDNRADAARLACRLDEINASRRSKQMKAMKKVEDEGVGDEPVIVKVGNWNEGVSGIVAGRMVERYKRPAFALTEVDGVLKGSGRSFGEFSLAEALKACGDVVISGGGHSAACGVKILPDDATEFDRRINGYYRSLGLSDQERFLELKEDIVIEKLGELTVELMDEIKQLEPFGMGNEEPIFLLKDVFVLDARRMGTESQHLALQLLGRDGEQMKVMSFFAPSEWLEVQKERRGDIWISLLENDWGGKREIEGRIVKMRLDETEVF